MKSLLALASAHKVATAVVAVAVAAGGVHAATNDDVVTATVTKVVDGDTIDVAHDGETRRVRLLNVDTPETVDPDGPVECLGPEASDYLRARLPVGTEVRLEHDVEEQDGYGRELAAVYLADELINASIAREGLGVAMSVGDNTKFLPPVSAAAAEARSRGVGLYSTTTPCTIPAQVEALETTAASTYQDQPATGAGLEALDDYAGQLVAVAATARSVMTKLDGGTDAFPLRAHDAVQITELRSRVAAVQTRLAKVRQSNAAARAAEHKRLTDEVKRAAEEAARKAAEEAARKAAEEEAARRAAEQAEAARQAAEAATSKPSAPRRTPSPGSGSSSGGGSGSGSFGGGSSSGGGGSSGSGGSDGYTGCRSYAPGGKTYTPIDCDTKKPIG